MALSTPPGSEIEMDRAYHVLQLVQQLTTRLALAGDLEEICRETLSGIQELSGVRRALLLLAEEDRTLKPAAALGLSDSFQQTAAKHEPWLDQGGMPEPIMISDLSRSAGTSLLQAAVQEHLRSLALWPVSLRGVLLGILIYGYDTPHEYNAEEKQMLRTIAGHVALAISRQRNEQALWVIRQELEDRVEKRLILLKDQITRRKQAEEELRKESARVKLLQQVAITSNEARSAEGALQRVLALIAEHLGWPFGHAYLPSAGNTNQLVASNLWICTDEEHFAPFLEKTRSTSFTLGEGWLGKAAVSGFPHWSADLSQDPSFIRQKKGENPLVRAGFVLPILADSEIAAVLEFFSSNAVEPEHELLELMTHISAQLGKVIERERAQERLMRQEMLLAQAERIAHLGSWGWEMASSTVTWSDELYRIYGVAPREFRASYKDFLSRVHADDRRRIAQTIDASINQKQPYQYHHRIVRPDGETRVLFGQCRPVLDDEGNVVRVFGTAQDVTIQVRLQEKLVRQAEQLQMLQRMGHDVTSTFDRKLIFQEVLAKLTDLLGAHSVFILLLEGDELIFTASVQNGPDDPTGRRIPADSGVAGDVLKSGKAVSLFGSEAKERTFNEFVLALGYRPGALLVAPLRLRGEMIGVLEAMHRDVDGFAEDDLQILESAASWTAIAVLNARLVAQLRTSHDRLRLLARQVVNAQEQERRRISHELHDEAGQALTALKISLDMIRSSFPAESAELRDKLGEAVEITDGTMEQIRRLAHGLHPPVLERFGLKHAAEGLCEDFARRAELDVRTNIGALPPVTEETAISLYRVLQEALTNAVKHAQATRINIDLSTEDDLIVLTVSDDGQGFVTTRETRISQSGMGLAGMQERMELLGGQLDITSTPGQGTRIVARVPASDQKEEP